MKKPKSKKNKPQRSVKIKKSKFASKLRKKRSTQRKNKSFWIMRAVPLGFFGQKKYTSKKKKKIIANINRSENIVLPKFYSSSVLRYYLDHCIKTLALHLHGEFMETDQFQLGIAAHAVLQEIGRMGLTDFETIGAVADQVVKTLTRKGRSFYDKPEPPMKPDQAILGRNLALNFIAQNPLPRPANYETTFSINRKGEACKFEDARLCAKIDCTYFTVDENDDYPGEMVVVRDYKSAWPTGEKDLQTLQRHIQGVMAYKHHGKGRTAIKMEVVNLRTGRIFSEIVKLDEEGIALLESWGKEALDACDTCDELLSAKQIKGVAGAGCYGCPFVSTCEECRIAADSKDDAIAYAAAVARASELKRRLLLRMTESEGIKVPGGKVGFETKKRNFRKVGAEHVILSEWHGKDKEKISNEHGKEVGLLQVFQLGVKNLYNFGKFQIKSAKVRGQFYDKVFDEQLVSSFGVWPDDDGRLEDVIYNNNGENNQ
jgi:hypothetical protein